VSIQDALLLALLGAVVGVFGTLVGAGGGFILTPILLLLYPTASPTTITAISLVVVFFNALSGSVAYARQRRIDYRSGIAFAAATFPGSVLGALVVTFSPRRVFEALTGLLLAVLAMWLLTHRGSEGQGPTQQAGSDRTITDRQGTTYRYRVRFDGASSSASGLGLCRVSSASAVASSTFPCWSEPWDSQPISRPPHPISSWTTWLRSGQ
jgi:uncharacterized membrane protein YfcA